MDDLMYYCMRPMASCNSASSRPQHPEVIFDPHSNGHDITVLLLNPFNDVKLLQYLAMALQSRCCR